MRLPIWQALFAAAQRNPLNTQPRAKWGYDDFLKPILHGASRL